MTKFMRILVGLAIAAAVLPVQAGSVQAQSPRTWVSSTGNDANTCGRTAPCKTFNGALAKTAPGGEITCVGPGDYGSGSTVNITKSIAISCEAGTALAPGSAGLTAITVNVGAADKVYLRGLDIEGAGTGNIGIVFSGAGALHVDKCLIRGFNSGIEFANGAAAALYVADSVIADGGVHGINIAPIGAAANVTLDRVQLTNNQDGIVANSGGGPVTVTITESNASRHSGRGFAAVSQGGPVLMKISRTTASQNIVGVQATGAQAQVNPWQIACVAERHGRPERKWQQAVFLPE
jgi:hypothetical protein